MNKPFEYRAARVTAAKLAVVISCYNYEAFVERAIRSILDQGRDDCELVVVDDGSTDRSWEVISRAGVTAFRTENGGQLAACLHGFDHTRAPFVLFLDADDELKPGALDVIIDRLDPAVAKLQFALTHVDADGQPVGAAASSLDSFRSRDDLVRRVLRSGVYKTPPTSGNVFRRDLCELLREVDYDRAVDGVILFAAPLFGDVLSLSDELGCYRIHGRNDSGLGRVPDAAILERDIARFAARMAHLRTIVQRVANGQPLVNTDEAFYFRERKLYLDIVSGRRPRPLDSWRLFKVIVEEAFTLKEKLAMSAFVFLVSVLPNLQANDLLAYRLKAGDRSLSGFLKQMMGRRAPALS